MLKSILCFGDSNTWGFNPETTGRYSPDVRWTGVLQAQIGSEWRVIEEGLNGRTSVWDDPLQPGRNGRDYLAPCLDSHRPLDVVVLFLGLNDLKKRYSAAAEDIARGVGVLIELIQRSGAGPQGNSPRIVVLAPPPLGKLSGYAEAFESDAGRSRRVASFLREIAANAGCQFMDTAAHVVFSDTDGLHFDPDAHAILGRCVADLIQTIGC